MRLQNLTHRLPCPKEQRAARALLRQRGRLVVEADDLGRFANVESCASYCRCVDGKRLSNEEKKGESPTRQVPLEPA